MYTVSGHIVALDWLNRSYQIKSNNLFILFLPAFANRSDQAEGRKVVVLVSVETNN